MGQRQHRLLTATSRTANTESAALNTQGVRNVTFDIDVASITGTSVTFTVHGYDDAAAEWYSILASTAQTTAGRTALSIGPDIVTAANVGACRVLPLRVKVVTTGTWNPAVFSVTATVQRDN